MRIQVRHDPIRRSAAHEISGRAALESPARNLSEVQRVSWISLRTSLIFHYSLRGDLTMRQLKWVYNRMMFDTEVI